MENWERRKYLLDGIRKALHVKQNQGISDDDLDMVIAWSNTMCPLQFAPMIEIIKECPMNNPGKWGNDYKCHECWMSLLIDNRLRKYLEFIEGSERGD
ncbi:hypothetical protein ACTUHY_00530 [Acidaminococcus sp. LBK-2]|uniref:hypothetical protein n=1 Tax=Acidaminococcus sp. LBK-2 TaxID=3456956 RepID=UPI003FA4985B